MDTVKIAVVGAGAMVNSAHAPSLIAMPDVEVVGICDVVAERAEQTAQQFRIRTWYADYRALIEETDPDAVYVVVPPQYLFDIALYALERGKHLFTEKPPGVHTEQTRQLALTAERSGCRTMVGFQRRYTPITVECRRRVLDRGPVYQVVASFLKCYEGGPIYGGALDLLYADVIHIVDAIRWMAGGDACEVHADVRAHDAPFANSFNALIRFDNGVVGYLQSNHAVGGRQLRLEMHGRRISCLVSPEESATVYADGALETTLDAATLAGGPEMFRIGFAQEARHFVDCVKGGRDPDTDFFDALETMKLCDTIMRNSPPWTER